MMPKRLTLKEMLIKEFPPTANEKKLVGLTFNFEDRENVQDISNQIIGLMKERDMTYIDAYAMLGYVKMDLEYRATQLNL